MALFGSLIAIGSALLFGAVTLLVIWGVRRTLRREIATGFRSVPPPSTGRVLTVLGTVLPAIGAALLALLAAVRIIQVALGF